ncbi:MAG TPA: TetR family transcriptional regulator C-terminal domain-containing protein [Steroidobacteraceae bacterium]|nr:TetR family transcriptional regulator C-terminal domain-containing protein [Steroidobacteraceae bacterium]
MPKIVDHAQRRDEIALVACRVVAAHGFDRASMVRIASEAGYTTGMLAHYFDSKQEIIIAALRLILRRIEERLTRPTHSGRRPDLLELLLEALPIDAHRHIECAFWITFWGQVSSDKRLKRINAWVHREYMRLFERCLDVGWEEWRVWPAATREQVLRSLVTFINGLTASAVANPGDWPPPKQTAQLRLQLQLLQRWAARPGLASRALDATQAADG